MRARITQSNGSVTHEKKAEPADDCAYAAGTKAAVLKMLSARICLVAGGATMYVGAPHHMILVQAVRTLANQSTSDCWEQGVDRNWWLVTHGKQ